jgi:hypothetical protein
MLKPSEPDAWSERRLQVLLIGTALALLLSLVGLGFAVASVLRGGPADAPLHVDDQAFPMRSDGTRGSAYRDAVAAEPMLQTGEDDLKPAPPARSEQRAFAVDAPTRVGPAHVTTGFRHSAAGAVAQLAAIEVAVMLPMSTQNARDVFEAWSEPAANFKDWELASAIRSFHAAAGTTEGDKRVAVTAEPVGAQVKGGDGPDWVLACVQMDITVSVTSEARFGYGHCSRMAWNGSRWLIGSGNPAAQAPATWPGSQRSVEAGWLRWVERGDS